MTDGRNEWKISIMNSMNKGKLAGDDGFAVEIFETVEEFDLQKLT